MAEKILIGISVLIGIYFLICIAIGCVRLLKMNRQFLFAQNLPLGEKRYLELKNQKVVTDYKLYTDEEIKNDATLAGVKLYYFPCDGKKRTKYMMICPGGAYSSCSVPGEGYSIAAAANALGYTAFILEYRTGKNSRDRAPLKDLAAAFNFVNAKAEEFNVEKDGYSVCGFSAGGNLAALFGTESLGWKKFNLSKPAALILGYPWCNPNAKGGGNLFMTLAYAIGNEMSIRNFLGKGASLEMKKSVRVPWQLTENYPATYVMHGYSDVMVPMKTNSDVLVKILTEKGVPVEYKRCKGVNHGCGLGLGTSAYGWFDEAVAFWERVSK